MAKWRRATLAMTLLVRLTRVSGGVRRWTIPVKSRLGMRREKKRVLHRSNVQPCPSLTASGCVATSISMAPRPRGRAARRPPQRRSIAHDHRLERRGPRPSGRRFWVRRQGTFTLLDPDPADYPAEFLFTNDLKWIVREQKIGSGTSTLYLYRLASNGHIPARFRQQRIANSVRRVPTFRCDLQCQD